MTFAYALDSGYNFIYKSDQGTKWNLSLKNYFWESYTFELFGNLQLQFTFEILGVYKDVYTVNLILFDFFPYRQIIGWTDPFAVIKGAVAGFDFQVAGEYELKFLEIDIIMSQSAKGSSQSFVGFVQGLIAGTVTDYTSILPYQWSQWVYTNLPKKVNPIGLGVNDLFAWTNWYGVQPLWSLQVSNVIPAPVIKVY